MASLPEGLEGCIYTYLPEGIHELTLYDASEKTLRDCFVHLDTIFAQAPTNEPLLLLSDLRRSGPPPPLVLWGLALDLLRKYPVHPTIYAAYLYRRQGVYSLFITVVGHLGALYGARPRFFANNGREEAIAWLLESREVGKT